MLQLLGIGFAIGAPALGDSGDAVVEVVVSNKVARTERINMLNLSIVEKQ
jgi:hypothetical protein